MGGGEEMKVVGCFRGYDKFEIMNGFVYCSDCSCKYNSGMCHYLRKRDNCELFAYMNLKTKPHTADSPINDV